MVTFPMAKLVHVVSHPLKAYRKSKASERAGSIFVFGVLMHILCFMVIMYKLLLLSVVSRDVSSAEICQNLLRQQLLAL